MSIDNILFRASSVGKLMVEPKSKSETLSETTKDYLLGVYLEHRFGRKEYVLNKYTEKGNLREEDSITMVSRQMKKMFNKNDIRLNNDYITGELDIYEGKSISEATHTIDTKTSWNLHTFYNSKKKLDKMYYWQGQAYMALTGATKHSVAFCLCNNTEMAIMDEKKKLAYAMHVLDTSSDENVEYKEKCKQIEINHIFDIQSFMNECPWFEFDNDVNNWSWDIPFNKRIYIYTFDRNDDEINTIYEKVKLSREYIKTLDA